jgi:ABC-type antimicrobial peptide transport system permease subunit
MPFSAGRLVRRSIWFHRSVGLAVALGVAAATAVVSGALLVGDSMRGSLRGLTLERLGEIDAAVMPGSFFNASRVPAGLPSDVRAIPAIYFARGVVESSGTAGGSGQTRTRRSGNVQLIASGPSFWDLGIRDVRPATFPGEQGVVLNRRTADELGVEVGDRVTVRLPAEQAVPADSPLGRRESQSEGLPRLEIVDIIPNEGLGRFAIQPSQATPLCAYLAIETVQDVLEREGQANMLLLSASGKVDQAAADRLTQQLTPQLSDFGLQLDRVRQTFGEDPERVIFDYYNLTSERLLIADPIVEAVRAELGPDRAQPLLTYLANAIEPPGGEPSIPYSTLTAIDPSDSLPLDFATDEALPEQVVPIVLNSWAAEQLGADAGDPLRVAYFEPETSGGEEIEQTFEAVVTDVVPLTQPSRPYRRSRPAVFDRPPTVYNDPDLTPTVPGVTDQDSINDWDLPFTLERDISQADDDYWAEHRLTPKAYIPLEAGRRLFGSRFGNTSGLRIDVSVAESVGSLADRLAVALRERQGDLGFAVLPIKQQQLNASRGTTPFDALFLSLSFFVIVAALMLVALLFRLGLEQRAAEYGTLMAVGLPGRQVSRLALVEGTLLAVPGAMLGVVGGVLYALAVLWALGSWWVGAVTVPFLQFHWTWTSVIGGLLAGVVMAALTIMVTARRLRRADVRPLLSGRIPEPTARHDRRRGRRDRWLSGLALTLLLAAVALGVIAIGLSGPAQAGAFVGGGMLLLTAMLLFAYVRLTSWRASETREMRRASYSIVTLALRSVGRNPIRSTLSIGLMAVACFLIISMSAFQMRPSDSGVGGFDLIGQSAVPIYKDLGRDDVQREFLGQDARQLAATKIFGLRFRPGQDASCNNLYQASQPQVLGVPPRLVDWYAGPTRDSSSGKSAADKPAAGLTAVPFDWAAVDAVAVEQQGLSTPWELLQRPARGTADDPVPVILDQNTALWSLQMRGGVGEVRSFTFDDGGERYFQVVGLLGNTVLQGSLMDSEENFRRLFPEINGYSYFLLQAAPGEDLAAITATLEDRLGDAGIDMVPSRRVLAGLMAVQNTYLKTFQSLGALGLLLGTLGLAVVQLRNVLERRGELALLRAVGFSSARLVATVMIENVTLLLGGILCGALAALAAVIPYMLTAGTQPAIAQPLWMLGLVTLAGLLAGTLAMRKVLRLPLLENL